MAGDDNGDELDGRTVMQAPSFDELVAERERQVAADGGPTAGAGPADPLGLDPNAKTAMAPSYDERIAMANARSPAPTPAKAPDPFAPPPAAGPGAKADLPPPWAAPGSAGPASPLAAAPAAAPPPARAPAGPPAQGGFPPAGAPAQGGFPPAGPPQVAPPGAATDLDAPLPKTMMLNADDWGGVIPPPEALQDPGAPGFGTPPGGAMAAQGAPGFGTPPGAPMAVAAPYGGATAEKKGLNPAVLFFVGLGLTFLVGSCIVGISVVLFL